MRVAGLHSESAVSLLMGTAAVESALGEYWFQIGGGPALGPFQMEPFTERDIWANWLRYQPKIKAALAELGYSGPDEDRLQYDLRYQILMARIHYLRVKEALPEYEDIQGMARYWKTYYNTKLGDGTPEKFMAAWRKYVA